MKKHLSNIEGIIKQLVLEIGSQVTRDYEFKGGIWEGMSVSNVKTIKRYLPVFEKLFESEIDTAKQQGREDLIEEIEDILKEYAWNAYSKAYPKSYRKNRKITLIAGKTSGLKVYEDKRSTIYDNGYKTGYVAGRKFKLSQTRQKLNKLWKSTIAIYPCSGGKNCENYKTLTKVNQTLAGMIYETKIAK